MHSERGLYGFGLEYESEYTLKYYTSSACRKVRMRMAGVHIKMQFTSLLVMYFTSHVLFEWGLRVKGMEQQYR